MGQGARVRFGVGGSLTVPLGDFHADASGDGFKAGWQGLALVDVQPRTSPVGFRLDFSFGENSSNDQLNADLTAAVGAPTTAKIKLLGGTADVAYHFKPSTGGLAGYMLGGLGLYNVKLAVTSQGVTADSSETKFSWNVGAGLSFAVGGAAVFFEARYLDVAKSFDAAKTSYVPITVGVRFGGK
jgi:opacity protein-like surface antigen